MQIQLLGKFPVGIAFRVHLPQNGPQKSQIGNQIPGNPVRPEQKSYVADAVGKEIVMHHRYIRYPVFLIAESLGLLFNIFPFKERNFRKLLLGRRLALIFLQVTGKCYNLCPCFLA